jgi:hypothetical protein
MSDDIPNDFTGIAKCDNNTLHYYKGKLHNKNGPAIINNDGSTEYFVDGRRHRIEGAAIVRPNGQCYFFLNGKNVTEEKHKEIVSMIDKYSLKKV